MFGNLIEKLLLLMMEERPTGDFVSDLQGAWRNHLKNLPEEREIVVRELTVLTEKISNHQE